MNETMAAGRTVLVSAVLATLLFATLGIAGSSMHTLWLLMLVVIIVVPMGLRYILGWLDLFEPLVLANVALAVMFIGRPLADIALGTRSHIGLDITATFDEALLVATAGVLAFQIGYHSPFARSWSRVIREPRIFRPQRAFVTAWLFAILGASLFTLFLAQSGGLGLLFMLFKGRSAAENGIFVASTGYFYDGILMFAASALIFFALGNAVKRRLNYVWCAVTALPMVIFLGARGDRSHLLPLILGIPTFWCLWNNRRPSPLFLFAAIIIGVVIISWEEEIRNTNSMHRADSVGALIEALSSPLDQIGKVLSTQDDEMFDSLANELQVVPYKVAYRPLGALTDLGIRALPRPLWPAKPLETNDAIVAALWPAHYKQSRASAAFSIIGPFYMDSGLIGVVLGMFGLGVTLAMLWKWYLRYRTSLDATLIFSMCLPFVVILMRGSLPDTLSLVLFMVVPLVILSWLSRLGLRSSEGRVVQGVRIKYE